MKRMRQLLIVSIFFGALLSANGQSRMKFNVHADPQFAWLSSDEDEVARGQAPVRKAAGAAGCD